MGELIERLRQQMLDFFQVLSTRQKIIIGASLTAVIVLAAVFVVYLNRVDYVPLAQNVTLTQASEITAKLDELGIKWKDDAGTSQIWVDEKQLSKARMTLAVEGLMSEKEFSWTDVFATNSLTMTSEEKSKMYLIAQASGLSQALESLEGIESANVQLYIPNDSNYLVTEGVESKASVILKIEEGKTLNEQQVQGIVMVLVNSVKGLEADKVSVVDSTGRELNKRGQGTADFALESQMDMKVAIEERLNARLLEMLGTLYGEKNVKIMTSVKLDFDSQTTISKAFKPPVDGETNGIVRSITEITDDVVNGTSASGAPGTDTNSETTNYNESVSNTTNTIKKSSRTLNYELNEISTQVEKAKGQITDITAGIIINTDALLDNTLTEAHKAEVISLVTSSAGLDTKQVSVSALKFADPYADMDLITDKDTVGSNIPILYIALGIVALIAIGFGVYMFLQNKKKQAQLAEEEQARAAALAQEQKELEEIQLELEDRTSPKFQIEKFIDTNPEAVAQLLRNWINED